MRYHFKRVCALALALGLSVCLASCGEKSGLSKEDAAVYVQGVIEENYLGTCSKEYMDLVGIGYGDVDAAYEASIQAEVSYFIYNYSIEHPTDELREELTELYEDIYKQIKFEVVSAAEQDDGSFSVKVSVDPLNIAHLAEEKLDEALEPFYEKYTAADVENMSDEEYEAVDQEWAGIILDAFQTSLPEMGYLETQSVSVQLEKDEDGYYAITDDDFRRLDALVIDYPYDEE